MPSETHRRALYVCAQARFTTEDLRAVERVASWLWQRELDGPEA